jgi:4-amino-4-deoxy-L-arabinose transferase-like glycosyltransferase
VYGDIAKNWLQHGVYGLSGDHEIYSTYIRLPGYPAFLAIVFAIFGSDHYRAVLCVQMLVDVAGCFVIADIARRLCSDRIAKIAFIGAALCPFLANYAAAALSETLEIFFTALALDFAIAGVQTDSSTGPWWISGMACAAAILLRPDGGLIWISVIVYLVLLQLLSIYSPASYSWENKISLRTLRGAFIFAIVSLAPLIPWTIRNWVTFHRVQPLAPRYANEADEFAPVGFNRWAATWIAEYTSVQEIYWNVPGAKIDMKQLPTRAVDDSAQQAETSALFDAYNSRLQLTQQLDERFDRLARERIQQHRFRYYIGLPIARIVDMWMRPRTELLPPDPRWWEFNDDWRWSVVAVGFGVLNLAYVLLACLGVLRGRKLPYIGLPLTFLLIRTAFLGTLENPEPRYTLECYPAVIVFASMVFVFAHELYNSQQRKKQV